jgi:hypothetical protein
MMNFKPVIFVEHFHDGEARIYSREIGYELQEMSKVALDGLKAEIAIAPPDVFFRGFGIMRRYPTKSEVLALIDRAKNSDLLLH